MFSLLSTIFDYARCVPASSDGVFIFLILLRVAPRVFYVARPVSEVIDVPGLLVSVAGTSECKLVKSDCYVSLDC